ncbi:MFS family permease [Saccharothrix tamanrassetensis]|uniref:MFS family permease n=1 Tax=Saccharothrix tamanrassetensis TaxID=1051531 RepID=A0A841CHY7_9PSEU|nr:MFS transporter [Saccharothrix tamanrassetensis]MBB5958142.1 MFS family permease [Saccharothrix tamanrassetensis]
MATQNKSTGIWTTFVESPMAVKAVLGGVFVNKIGGFLNIFLVLFLTAKGYSAGQAATALGVYGVGSVIGVLVGGALADRLGARNSTVLSMAGSAGLIAALLYLPSYPLLIVATALVGAVGQVYRPASATLLSELTDDDRQVMIFAMYRFGLNLGTTAAPLIGFALYQWGGDSYHLLFWGEALVALAYAVLAHLALPSKAEEKRIRAGGDDEAAPASTGSYADVFRDRRYLAFLFVVFINGVVYVQYLSTLPLDVQKAGVPIFWYTFAVALNGAVVILFELVVTKKTQNMPAKVVVATCFVLLGLGVAAYGLPLGPAVIITGTLLWTLAEIIGGPVVFSYPGVVAPAHLRGRYIGSFQFVYGLGAAAGPIVGGFLFLQLGHAVWPVLGALSFVAAAVGFVATKDTKKETPAAEPVEEPVTQG